MLIDNMNPQYAVELRECEFFTRQEEAALALLARNGCQRSRHALIRSALPLAVKIAAKYRGKGIAMDDLVQLGNLGVIRAVDKFDPGEHGTRLTTYATLWIMQMIRKEFAVWRGTVVKHPVNAIDRKGKYRLVETLPFKSMHFVDDRGRVKEREIRDHRQRDPADIAHLKLERERLAGAIAQLPDRLRLVLECRLEGQSLNEIADDMGICRERARQLEMRAIGLLMKSLGVRRRAGDERQSSIGNLRRSRRAVTA